MSLKVLIGFHIDEKGMLIYRQHIWNIFYVLSSYAGDKEHKSFDEVALYLLNYLSKPHYCY